MELTAKPSCQATEGVFAAMPDGSEVTDLLRLCWCCLKDNPDKELHTPYSRHDSTEIYSNMLQECFNIYMTEAGDSCPGICEACVVRLRDASDFKVQVLRSQAELRAWLHRTSKAIDKVTAVKAEIADNDEGDDTDDMLSEGHVLKFEVEDYGSYTNSVILQEPQEVSNASSEDNCINWSGVSVETEATDGAREVDYLSSLELSSIDKCFHDRVKEQLRMDCSVRLQRIRTHKTPQKPYTCEICFKNFNRSFNLKKHLSIHTDEKPYACSICNKEFSQKESCDRHSSLHATLTHFCDLCKKMFRFKSELARHSKFHTKKKRFSCEVCGKSFTKMCSVNLHLLTHTGEKPHNCDMCTKQFTRKESLKRHIALHAELPFTCFICQKLLRTDSDLNEHIRKHILTDKLSFSLDNNKKYDIVIKGVPSTD